MNKRIKLNYNETFADIHSRDYYRGRSFHFAGPWESGVHYINDNYETDFVTYRNTLLRCRDSHLSSLENEPKTLIYNEGGNIIGVNSEHWDFILAGVKSEIAVSVDGVIYIDGEPLSERVLSDENYTTAEKQKLNGIESGAQVNVLEGVKYGGADLPIVNKKVNVPKLDLSPYATKTEVQSGLAAKYDKKPGGIPKEDLSSSVQNSLDLANSALQEVDLDDVAFIYVNGVTQLESLQYEYTRNKVNYISSESTNVEYPSAKAVYDALVEKQDVISDLDEIRAGAQAGTEALHIEDLEDIAFINIDDNTEIDVEETYESSENKVTSISANSTDAQYPSALAVYNLFLQKQDVIQDLSTIRSNAQLGATALQPGDILILNGGSAPINS